MCIKYYEISRICDKRCVFTHECSAWLNLCLTRRSLGLVLADTVFLPRLHLMWVWWFPTLLLLISACQISQISFWIFELKFVTDDLKVVHFAFYVEMLKVTFFLGRLTKVTWFLGDSKNVKILSKRILMYYFSSSSWWSFGCKKKDVPIYIITAVPLEPN